jgi:siderophore synthetase component
MDEPRDTPADRDLALQLLEERKALEEKQRELFQAYANWSYTPSGAKVLAHLESELREMSYRPGRDAMETAFREGRRAIVLDILDNVKNGRLLVETADLERSDLQQAAEQGDIFES